jgi:hypothetical protein
MTLERHDGARERPRVPGDPANALEPVQMALFAPPDRKLQEELGRLDLSKVTPIEALNLLHKWSEEAKK